MIILWSLYDDNLQGAPNNYPLATLKYFSQNLLFQLEICSICRGGNLTYSHQVLFKNIKKRRSYECFKKKFKIYTSPNIIFNASYFVTPKLAIAWQSHHTNDVTARRLISQILILLIFLSREPFGKVSGLQAQAQK